MTVWRGTFLRQHVARQLHHPQRLEVLAVEEVLYRVESAQRPGLNRREHAELRELVLLKRFFYADEPDRRLYVPIPINPLEKEFRQPAEILKQQLEDQARVQSLQADPRQMESRSRRGLYHDLTDLLDTMDQTRKAGQPDGRGILLVSRSGAGKTVACRKAFFDCCFASAGLTPRLGRFVPCWLSEGLTELSQVPADEMLLRGLWMTAFPEEARRGAAVDEKRLEVWLKYGPPILIFIDLNTEVEEIRIKLAAGLIRFQQTWGQYGHRCVVTLRSVSLDGPVLQLLHQRDGATFGRYDLMPLDHREAVWHHPDSQESVGYLPNLRRWHQELDQQHQLQLAEPDVPHKQRENAFRELSIQHSTRGPGGVQVGIVSTPLLLHLLTVAPSGRVNDQTSLAELFYVVLEEFLNRDYKKYGQTHAGAGLGRQEMARLAELVMTRLAVAILNRGPESTRWPRRQLAALMTQPRMGLDGSLRKMSRREAESPLWDNSRHPLARIIRDLDNQRLLEQSLIVQEGDDLGFLHDSFLYYFSGCFELLRPDWPDPTPLSKRAIARLVRRLVADPARWAWPVVFVAGALAEVDRRRKPGARLLPVMLAELAVLIGTSAEWDLFRRAAAGPRGHQLCAALLNAVAEIDLLCQHYPADALAGLLNVLARTPDPHERVARWRWLLELRAEQHPRSRHWLRWLPSHPRATATTTEATDSGLVYAFLPHRLHADAVRALAVLPGGRVVSGSSDNTVRVWCPDTGDVHVMDQHTRAVNAVAVLPDGRVVSGSLDSTVRVWNLDTGDVQVMDRPTGSFRALAVLPDGRVVSGSWDGTVRVWHPDTRDVQVMQQHTRPVNALAVLPDGRVVSGSHDNTVRVWHPNTGDVKVMQLHAGWVRAVAVLPDGRVVSGSHDNTVRVWHLDTGDVQVMAQHTNVVLAVAVLPDGRVVSGSVDHTVRVWHPETSDVVTIELGAPVLSLAVRPNGKILAGTVSGDVCEIIPERIERMEPEAEEAEPLVQGSEAMLPNGRTVSLNSREQTATAREPDGGWYKTIGLPVPPRFVVAVSGQLVAIACTGRLFVVWDLDRNQVTPMLAGLSSMRTADGKEPEIRRIKGLRPSSGPDRPESVQILVDLTTGDEIYQLGRWPFDPGA